MGFAVESHNARMLGSGEKVVVLGHGFGSDQSVWKHMVPRLVGRYRVILYDNMGAGTTNPDYFDFEKYSSLEGFSADLIAVLEEFEVKNCIYLGHSLSSMTGAIASIFRPDLFHKLILFAGSPRFVNTEDYYGGFEREEVDQLCTAMETNYTSWISGFAPLVVSGDMDSVAVQEFGRTLFSMRPDIALSVLRMVFNFDLRHFLGRVSVPCHIVQSSKDMAVPLAVAEYLHQNVGGRSIVEVVATEGHIPQLSAPEVAIPVLLRHIEYDIAD